MIKKLSQRIFYLILISLSVVVLGVIILFVFLNYNNTINSRATMIDCFVGKDFKKPLLEQPKNSFD